MMDELTMQEIEWAELTLKSTTAIREQLLAGETPEAKALYELCNRADALIWHLARRDARLNTIRERQGNA